MPEAIDYSYSPPNNSIYLRLKTNGETIKIRLVTEPVKYLSDFKDKNTGQVTTSEKYAWLVIDRADGKVKVFQCGKDIWKKVSALVKNPDWGSPLTYDLTITRLGLNPQNFYDVAPSPNNKGEITEEEKQQVMTCGIDLAEALKPKAE